MRRQSEEVAGRLWDALSLNRTRINVSSPLRANALLRECLPI
jgi:hypothetical protein